MRKIVYGNMDVPILDKIKFFQDLGYKPHPNQWLIHENTARYRIAACGSRWGKSWCAAYEALAMLMYENVRGWIVAPCVDATTEILSKRGWLTYDKLNVGDEVLTLNNQGLGEWQNCLKINTFNYNNELVHITQKGHNSLTTPHHRWLVGYTTQNTKSGRKRTLGYRFTTTDKLTKSNEFIVCGARIINLPLKETYDNNLVELIGWYWTEGSFNGSGIRITQNKGNNTDRIRKSVLSLFGEPSSIRNYSKTTKKEWKDWKPRTKKYQEKQGDFYFNKNIAQILISIAPNKVIKSEFITSLTQKQLELLIEVSVLADGHKRERKSKSRKDYVEQIIVQKRKDRLEQLQFAVQLAGLQSTLKQRDGGIWCLHIFERNKIWLGQKPQLKNRERIHYSGVVWCPTTHNGTWLARRNGTVYFTGNTYELTDKVFREIYAISANKLPDFIEKESYANKEIKYINGSEIKGKTGDNLISLAGEALDFIIVDEAPGLKEDVWTHYLRERIVDREGWVLFIGTPRGRNWYYQMFLRGQDTLQQTYKSFHYTTYDNLHISRAELESIKRELGGESLAYRQEILAEFLSEADSVFRHIREAVSPCLRDAQADGFYVGGLDLAKYQDYTVLTIADYHTNEIVYYDRWHRVDWNVTYDRVAAALRRYRNPSVYVDSTGLGDPIFETLRKPPYNLNVKPFKFTQDSKRQLVDNLAWFFENRQIKIPDVPELINELEVFEYEMSGQGKPSFNAPSGYHDDCVISLALTVLGLQRKSDFVMGEIDLRRM